MTASSDRIARSKLVQMVNIFDHAQCHLLQMENNINNIYAGCSIIYSFGSLANGYVKGGGIGRNKFGTS